MCTETIRLLLVEDNSGDANLLRLSLRNTEATAYALTHAEDLDTALHLLESNRFDVVLLDLSLPDCQGMATLEQVQANAPETPIVVLTGNEDETLGVKAVQAGAEDYLVKGEVNAALLTRAVRYAIERHRILCKLKDYDRLKTELLATVSLML